MKAFDLAIVGSGFGGSLLALVARRLGRSVILLEKDAHPRFAIGESTSPLANLLLERIALRYDLPAVLPLAKWGTWQDAFPHVRGGVKRGFTFYHHRPGSEPGDEGLRNPLLVAASPNARVADTHWYRADVDLHFLEQARAAGAEYVDRIALDAFDGDGKIVRLSGRRGTEPLAIEARFVADASGPRGFLQRTLGLEEGTFPGLPGATALYAHFRGVAAMAETSPLAERTPYPVDEAALHHVFDGGWIWVLRFSEGTVSAGAMLSPELARQLRAEDGEPAWRRLIARFPAIERQFRRAELLFPFRHAENVAFRTTIASGPRWWMLPSAAAFVDPLLSTGIPLTLLGVARAGEALEAWGDDTALERRLGALADRTLDEADAAAVLVAALWKRFGDFPAFCAATMLYFAAASFGEASCRLGRDDLPGFLGSDRPALRSAILRSLAASEISPPAEFTESVRREIEPWNVAGLLDPARRNWYPVRADDLRAGAGKLGASPAEIERLLDRSGFGVEHPFRHVP